MENIENTDEKTPKRYEESLRRMSYSELKKEAKSRGMKLKNIKAEKLIAKLLSSSVTGEDLSSFDTPEQKKINSSQKSKEEMFDKDAATPLQTPRRGTYSVDSPSDNVFMSTNKADSSESAEKETLAVDDANVTILRGSERKLRPRKVSFLSPKRMTPRNSPKYMSLKDRPKTPIASRKVVITTPLKQEVKKTPSVESSSSLKRSASKENARSAQKRLATPNFKKIHQKAFDKMESIDDYQKRKVFSAKKLKKTPKPVKKTTKIPVAFGGIPFIPSVLSCNDIKFNFANQVPKTFQVNNKEVSRPVEKPTSAVKTIGQKPKFDLQASLAKKLRYKPYTGAMKPLKEANCGDMPLPPCHHNVKEPIKPVVQDKRLEARSLLKGVRTNRRFDLQMKSRNIK